MTTYYMNEAAFALPEGEVADRTVTQIVLDAGGGESILLGVHRRPFPTGASLAVVVAESQRDADRALPSHAVLFQREAEIGGAFALETAAQWRGDDGMLYSRHAHVVLDGVWLMFVGNSPLGARAACDAHLDRLVATFRRRG